MVCGEGFPLILGELVAALAQSLFSVDAVTEIMINK